MKKALNSVQGQVRLELRTHGIAVMLLGGVAAFIAAALVGAEDGGALRATAARSALIVALVALIPVTACLFEGGRDRPIVQLARRSPATSRLVVAAKICAAAMALGWLMAMAWCAFEIAGALSGEPVADRGRGQAALASLTGMAVFCNGVAAITAASVGRALPAVLAGLAAPGPLVLAASAGDRRLSGTESWLLYAVESAAAASTVVGLLAIAAALLLAFHLRGPLARQALVRVCCASGALVTAAAAPGTLWIIDRQWTSPTALDSAAAQLTSVGVSPAGRHAAIAVEEPLTATGRTLRTIWMVDLENGEARPLEDPGIGVFVGSSNRYFGESFVRHWSWDESRLEIGLMHPGGYAGHYLTYELGGSLVAVHRDHKPFEPSAIERAGLRYGPDRTGIGVTLATGDFLPLTARGLYPVSVMGKDLARRLSPCPAGRPGELTLFDREGGFVRLDLATGAETPLAAHRDPTHGFDLDQEHRWLHQDRPGFGRITALESGEAFALVHRFVGFGDSRSGTVVTRGKESWFLESVAGVQELTFARDFRLVRQVGPGRFFGVSGSGDLVAVFDFDGGVIVPIRDVRPGGLR